MKKVILFVTIAVLYAASFNVPAQEKKIDPSVLCPALGNSAETIMRARQDGYTLTELLENYKEVIDNNGSLGSVVKEMIMQAFEEPAYMTESMQERAVLRHRTLFEKECYKAAGY